MENEENDVFVTALARGLSVIRAFDRDHPRQTLSEIAQRTNLSRATARRSILTLCRLGYAEGDGKYFSLTANILRLGYAYLSAAPLPRIIQPVLDEVTLKTGFSCSVSVLKGAEVIYIARSAARKILSVDLAVGSALPAFCTSMGRVMIAAQPEEDWDRYLQPDLLSNPTPHTILDPLIWHETVRDAERRGWASVDQELELGLWSVAVPLRDQTGNVIAAMNVSLPTTQFHGDATRKDLVSSLLQSVERIAPFLTA